MMTLLINKSRITSGLTYKFKVLNLYFGFKMENTKLELITLYDFGFFKIQRISYKRIEFKPIRDIVSWISENKPNQVSFSGKSYSSVIKVYVDTCIFKTRCKGKLKLKNGHFKTNLKWLSEELTKLGYEDRTPSDWSMI